MCVRLLATESKDWQHLLCGWGGGNSGGGGDAGGGSGGALASLTVLLELRPERATSGLSEQSCAALTALLHRHTLAKDTLCASAASVRALVGLLRRSADECAAAVTPPSAAQARLLLGALAAVRTLTHRHETASHSVGRLGGCEALLAALCWAVTDLAVAAAPSGAGRPRSRTLAAAGGASVAVAAADMCLSVIRNLTLYLEPEHLPELYEQFLAGGGCEVFSSALSAAGSSEAALLQNLLATLRNLTHDSSAVRVRLCDAGACEALVVAVSAADSAVAAEHGAACIANMAVEHCCRGRLGEAGACAAVVRLIRLNVAGFGDAAAGGEAAPRVPGGGSGVAAVDEECCVAITNLLWGDHLANLRRLREADAHSALQDAIGARSSTSADLRARLRKFLPLLL